MAENKAERLLRLGAENIPGILTVASGSEWLAHNLAGRPESLRLFDQLSNDQLANGFHTAAAVALLGGIASWLGDPRPNEEATRVIPSRMKPKHGNSIDQLRKEIQAEMVRAINPDKTGQTTRYEYDDTSAFYLGINPGHKGHKNFDIIWQDKPGDGNWLRIRRIAPKSRYTVHQLPRLASPHRLFANVMSYPGEKSYVNEAVLLSVRDKIKQLPTPQ